MKERLLSLDVFRGLTVMGMILVNNPGDWGNIYAPLSHAEWEGLTPTDLVYPFFMFLMGVSMTFSIPRLREKSPSERMFKVLKRTCLLVSIGIALGCLAHILWNIRAVLDGNSMSVSEVLFPWQVQRLPGVLQRLGLVYGIASLLILSLNRKLLPSVAVILLVASQIILLCGNGFEMSHDNILYKIDVAVFGENHLYAEWLNGARFLFDPEGIVGTIPCVSHVLIGYLVGGILHRKEDLEQRLLRLSLCGIVLLLSGWLLSYGCPVIKKVWTPSYVLITCGIATLVFVLVTYIIDVNRFDKWFQLPRDYGMNPLFLYIMSDIMVTIIGVVRIGSHSVGEWVYQGIHSMFVADKLSSLIFAITYVLFIGLFAVYLHRKHIYIRL